MLKPGIDFLKVKLNRLVEEMQELQQHLGEWETEDVHVTPASQEKAIKAEIVKALVELLSSVGKMTDSSIGYAIHRDVSHGPIRYTGPYKVVIEIVYNEPELKRMRAAGMLKENP